MQPYFVATVSNQPTRRLGAMKDPDLGIVPMTTSSHTLAGFGCVGAPVPPTAMEDVICVSKAYSSCVGSKTEPFVSELLGEKIENEQAASDVAQQLARINEQLAIKNRRARRIWKAIGIILAVIVLVNIIGIVLFTAFPSSGGNIDIPEVSEQLIEKASFHSSWL